MEKLRPGKRRIGKNPNLQATCILLTKDLHRQAHQVAAQRYWTLGELVRVAVGEYLNRQVVVGR